MTACPPTTQTSLLRHDLGTAENFVVTTLRLWAAPYRQPDETHPDWRDGFAAADAEDATAPFDALFRIVVGRSLRSLDVRCLRCPHLGDDEMAFIAVTRHLQNHRWGQAEALLADWLPADALGPALAQATLFATAIAAAGLALPEPPDRSVATGEVIRFPRAYAESTSVH